MGTSKEMTSGAALPLIFNFAMPVLLANLLQQTYSLIDAAIVGKFLGIDAFSAVGASTSVIFLIIGFCNGCCAGFGIPVAQKFGARDYSTMRRYVSISLQLAAVMSVIIAVVTSLYCRDILRIMQTPENIFRDAYFYLLVTFIGVPCTFFYNLLSSVIRALGDSKTPFWFLLFSTILNVILDLVCILVFKWGVAGAAIATLLSQGISAVLCYIYMYRRFEILRSTREERKFRSNLAGNLMWIGVPMGLQFSITAIGTIIVQGAVNIYGSVYMAGFSAAGKIQNIIATVFVAFGATMATYVGQNRGAGKMDRVKAGMKYTQIMLLIWSVITMIIMFFFGKYMTWLFIDKSQTDVINVSVTYFHTVFWAYPFLGSIFLYRNGLQGLGYGLVPMLGGVFELAARSAIVMFVAGKTSFAGVCLADPAAWIAALIPLIPYYIYVMKKWSRGKKETAA